MGCSIVIYVPAEPIPAQQYKKNYPLAVHQQLRLSGHSFLYSWQGLDDFKRGEEMDLQQKQKGVLRTLFTPFSFSEVYGFDYDKLSMLLFAYENKRIFINNLENLVIQICAYNEEFLLPDTLHSHPCICKTGAECNLCHMKSSPQGHSQEGLKEEHVLFWIAG